MARKAELKQLVAEGMAFKEGGRYFATPLAKAYQWASENLHDESDVPAEGIRYAGCLIRRVFHDGEVAIYISEIRQ